MDKNRRLFAPFKPPRPSSSNSPLSSSPPPQVVKRQRTIVNNTPQISHVINNKSSNATTSGIKSYTVLWRTKTLRRIKTWDGDGTLFLNCTTNTAVIKDESGYQIGVLNKNAAKIVESGEVFAIGSLEFEVDGELDETRTSKPVAVQEAPNRLHPQVYLNKKVEPFKPLVPTRTSMNTNKSTDFKPVFSNAKSKKADLFSPLFDSKNEGAVVMPVPPPHVLDDKDKENHQFVDIVVDPTISVNLRDHQSEGIKFLYECIMGFRDYNGQGAILADEMGMGKTLMTIALIWTLLRQNPFYHIDKSPCLRKVLICCPVTLVGNWNKEFKKWVGNNKVNVLCITGNKGLAKDKQDILSFSRTRVYQVLILGYEKMVSCANELSNVKDFDLVVCDEGHRLKNSSNKVLKTLESFQIKRRIVLSGTPIQNDLVEFFNIINFINPGILGDVKSFTKEYIKPILQSREANCYNDEIVSRGEEKSRELIELTKLFILRRTKSDTISKFLPLRTDYLLFVPPTNLQLKLFKSMESTSKVDRMLLSSSAVNDSLPLITTYRKLCNSPSLLQNDGLFLEICGKKTESSEDDKFRKGLAKKIKSGKVNILIKLLKEFYSVEDKVVLISNFTSTLDVLEEVIKALNLPFGRLDGSVPSKSRDKIVKDFNSAEYDKQFVFLLSAKSGGVGLNLIGANRLIMFDNDWNPSVDLQAMARVHRDGQLKPVYIYRLITSGCIDEKILQRQLIKTNLSDKFLDDGGAVTNENFFDYSDLRDLFTVQDNCKSNTHELMECDCLGTGQEIALEDDKENLVEDKDTEEEEEDKAAPKLAKKEGSWMSALDYQQLSQADGDKNFTKKKQAIIKCLAQYRHIDPLNFIKTETRKGNPDVAEDDNDEEVDDSIGDDALRNIIESEETNSLISYIFTRVHSN